MKLVPKPQTVLVIYLLVIAKPGELTTYSRMYASRLRKWIMWCLANYFFNKVQCQLFIKNFFVA